MLLCRFHHRLVHEVGYEISGTPSSELKFVRPDGTAVPDRPPALPGDALAVQRGNDVRAIEITEMTSIPKWDGSRPDYSAAVGLLFDVSAEAVG